MRKHASRLSIAVGLLALLAVPLSAGSVSAGPAGAPMVAQDASATASAPWPDTPVLPGPAVLPQPWQTVEPSSLRVDPDEFQVWLDGVLSSLPAQEQEDPYAVIDKCVADEMQAIGAPGASIAIAVNGVITYTKGYGVKHLENGGEIDAETMFRIGSTTKMMTAAALMTLVDQGEVDVNEPVTNYLPDAQLPAPWQASTITPHHLLTHSSGLPDTYLISTIEELTNLELEDWYTNRLPRTPLNAPPGSFWNYANPNFSLAGMIVQEIGGMPYEDYIEQHVWEPAGMPLTTFKADEVNAHGNFAYGHYGDERLTPEVLPMDALAPAGTAFSTPTEMVTWALLLGSGGGDVLSSASATAMQAPQVGVGYYGWDDYGYGVFVTEFEDKDDPSQSVTVYDHGGNVQGWSSELFWVPERGVAVSVLYNEMDGFGYAGNCVIDQLANVTRHSGAGLSTDPETWGPFEGTYAMMNQVLWDWTTRIEIQGDHLLWTDLDMGAQTQLMNVLNDTFMIDAEEPFGEPDPASAILDYTFIRDPDDTTSVKWLRSRLQVGERVGDFPPVVNVEGTACTPITFTAAIDMPMLDIRVSGLNAGPVVDATVPITETDSMDPSTASYKHDIAIEGEAGFLFVTATPQEGDALEMYLMHDANADGEFSYPDELAGQGLSGGAARYLLMPGRQEAGDYQLWVHGTHVAGPEHTFTLYYEIVDGSQLRVENAPTAAEAGESYSLDVCGQYVYGLEDPMIGMLEFFYGSPPRRVRIRVDWLPAEGFANYLPFALRDFALEP